MTSSPPEIYTTKKLLIVQERTHRIPVKPRKTGYKSPTTGAQSVSFANSGDSLSPLYDRKSDASYMTQCFNIIDCIGEGSFGIVYKVKSSEDGQVYAVKKSRERFRDPWDRKHKLTEVDTFERLSQHPHCVKLYKAWEEDGFLFQQMELCKYSLSRYTLMHHDISEEMVWNVLTDIALALKHLHDKNFMHMDVKLDNILVASDGSFKLGDFGIAIDCTKVLKDVIDGDPKYIAPEVMEDNISKPADIFSLGISLLELIYDLNLPHRGVLWHWLRQGATPCFDTHVSCELINLVKRMMHPYPDRRPTVEMILKENNVRKILKMRYARRIFHCMVASGKALISFFKFFGNVGLSVFRKVVQIKMVKKDQNLLDESGSRDEIGCAIDYGFVTSTPVSRTTVEYSGTPTSPRRNESWEISEGNPFCEYDQSYEQSYELSNSPSPDTDSPELPCRCRLKKRRNHPYRSLQFVGNCNVCSRTRHATARNLAKEFNLVDPDYKED